MNKKIYLLAAVLAASLSTGCIKHPVAQDYDKHLMKYGSETVLPKTNLESEYFIELGTQNHRYQFKIGATGMANVWIVEFGKILDKTLNAGYVQNAFSKLKRSVSGNLNSGKIIEFTLENYEFKHFHAYLTMKIEVKMNGNSIYNKTYQSEGRNQAGQILGAGAFGTKNSILKSTKHALDKVLSEFISDIKRAKLASN